ncbi:TadG family pilus assembly protein [Cupriavidus sp. 2KB_3]|uniref:TadG family pilus assembly protein n=1 Tax=Cupriavidus sp. 2KB_3 TaxID=3232980 RepID=UPI003F937EB5
MRPLRAHRHARGAVSLMAALLIATVGIAALVSIDVGHVFYSQRQLQKLVDLAALSGAQQLKRAADLPATTASVLGSVTAAAAQNGYASGVSADCADVAGGAADGLRACLGLWDPANPANGDSVRHFNPAYPAATVSPNAVRVQATYTVPVLFVIPGTASRQLRAEAIAAGSPPVASFTLGSGLLDVSTASGMLGLLLGNTVSLSVLDWSGLVGANVTLEQLRLQAGVGTIDQLLNATLSIQDFYALVLGAAGKSALLNAALGSPVTQLGVSGIGTTVSLAKMLDLGVLTPAASSAAEVAVNVASLLTTAAYVARGTSAIDLDKIAVNVGLGTVGGKLYIVQPPQVAVGPARQLPGGTWQTTATTAQLGLWLAVKANLPVLGLASADVNLPVWLRVAQARGDLTNVQCAANPAQRRATVNVTTDVLTTCVADGTKPQCAPAATPVDLAVVKLLGVPSTRLVANPKPDVTPMSPLNNVVLAPGGSASTSSTKPLSRAITDMIRNLNPDVTVGLGGLGISLDVGGLLDILLPPIAGLLDALLTPLTSTLGIRLGNADLWLNGVDCNNAELVY